MKVRKLYGERDARYREKENDVQRNVYRDERNSTIVLLPMKFSSLGDQGLLWR